MGAIIEAIHATPTRRWPQAEGSVAVAVRSAHEVLRAASCDPADVGVLVNASMYNDDNICEPAMAPFIQRRIRSNTVADEDRKKDTFSFDLMNGGCGFVNAIQVVAGTVESGRTAHGMIVTSDVHPSTSDSSDLDFAPAGAAALLCRGEPGEGFTNFCSESFPKHASLMQARIQWAGDDVQGWRRPRHKNVNDQHADYLPACVACIETSLLTFLGELGMTLSDIDLVIPSEVPAWLPSALCERLSIDGTKMVDTHAEFGPTLTASHALGVQAAMRSGRWQRACNILFVAVGAGITVTQALYRQRVGGGETTHA